MDLAAENPVHAALGEVERRLSSRAEIELSILMPCLNEAETLAACIEKATGFLHRSGVAGEVIVADNGSTDASRDIARALGARVVEVAAHEGPIGAGGESAASMVRARQACAPGGGAAGARTIRRRGFGSGCSPIGRRCRCSTRRAPRRQGARSP